MTTSNCGLDVTGIWGLGTAADASMATAPSETAADVSLRALALGSPSEDGAFEASFKVEVEVSRKAVADTLFEDLVDS